MPCGHEFLRTHMKNRSPYRGLQPPIWEPLTYFITLICNAINTLTAVIGSCDAPTYNNCSGIFRFRYLIRHEHGHESPDYGSNGYSDISSIFGGGHWAMTPFGLNPLPYCSVASQQGSVDDYVCPPPGFPLWEILNTPHV